MKNLVACLKYVFGAIGSNTRIFSDRKHPQINNFIIKFGLLQSHHKNKYDFSYHCKIDRLHNPIALPTT